MLRSRVVSKKVDDGIIGITSIGSALNNAQLIFAAYDKATLVALQDVDIQNNVTLTADQYVEYKIGAFINKNSGMTVKVFLWDSLGHIAPLTQEVVLEN